jgi:hypothetical protein
MIQEISLLYQLTESLFGQLQFKINLHSLMHMLTDILNFGPCFTHNCFAYESMNGILLSFIHNKQPNVSSALEAVSLMQVLQQSPTFNTHEDVISAFTKLNFESISGDNSKFNKSYLFDDCFSIGTKKFEPLNLITTFKLSHLFNTFQQTEKYEMYSQIRFNNIQYFASKFNNTKSNNSICIWKSEDTEYIGIIQVFIKINLLPNDTQEISQEYLAFVSQLTYKSTLNHFKIFKANSKNFQIIKIAQIQKRLLGIDNQQGEIWVTDVEFTFGKVMQQKNG